MPWYGYISEASILLPFCVVSFTKVGEPPERPVKLFIIYIMFAFVVQTVTSIMAYTGTHNLWVFHYFYPIQFYLLAFCLIDFEPVYKKQLFSFTVPFFVFAVLDQLVFSGVDSFSSAGLVAQSICLFVLAVRIFYIAVRRTVDHYTEFHFWIAAGILIYFGITVTMFIFFNIFQWALPLLVHSLTNTITNILFMWGYLCFLKRQSITSILY